SDIIARIVDAVGSILIPTVGNVVTPPIHEAREADHRDDASDDRPRIINSECGDLTAIYHAYGWGRQKRELAIGIEERPCIASRSYHLPRIIDCDLSGNTRYVNEAGCRNVNSLERAARI